MFAVRIIQKLSCCAKIQIYMGDNDDSRRIEDSAVYLGELLPGDGFSKNPL